MSARAMEPVFGAEPSRMKESFDTRGFIGPVSVLPPGDAREVAARLRRAPSAEWKKGYAASSVDYFDVAVHPQILDRVAALLGEDVMLWGASLVVRKPGQVHPWHTDLETAEGIGRTVSVWLGLANVNRNSSLQVIPGSHRFGITIQELMVRAGKDRREMSVRDVLAWALQRDSGSTVIRPEMGDGDAIFFDGRLWHGTDNTNTEGVRTALLLQYATPDRPIRMPDYADLAWPFQFRSEPLPPCIMVRGTDRYGVNRLVPPPGKQGLSWVKQLDLPLEQDLETGWKKHPIHLGSTRCLSRLSCHASVLGPGESPHDLHAHRDEEILLVLSGEATLVTGDRRTVATTTAPSGTLIYYPAGQRHTIRNGSNAPVTYLMFKWRGPELESEGQPLEMSVRQLEETTSSERRVQILLQGSTRYLKRLRAHLTEVGPGGGYDPHVDAYDVAIVVLRGTVETLGRRVGPNGVVFYSAGEPHGIRNTGDDTAIYVVFEFHALDVTRARERGKVRKRRRALLSRLGRLVPGRVRKVLKRRLRILRRYARATASVAAASRPDGS